MKTEMKAETITGYFRGSLEFLVILLTLIITNRRTWLCIYEIDKPLFWCEYGDWLQEFLWYVIILTIILILVVGNKLLREISLAWLMNWKLIIFLLLGISSSLWSINIYGTIQRIIQVILSALIASYLGVRYKNKDWLMISAYFGITIIAASLLLVAFLPGAAIMSIPPHEGAWRGVFSHRNYTGSIIAFCCANLVLWLVLCTNLLHRIIAVVFLLLGIAIIIQTGSATGIILFLLLNFGILLYILILRWGHLIPRLHPSVWIIILLFTAGLFIYNADYTLGLFNRSSNLTGRIPLWGYLLEKVNDHNIWLGYGLGTIWTFEEFRVQAANDLGWNVQIINAHNGFIDILLYLGIIGVISFFSVFADVISGTIRFVNKERTLQSSWAIMTLLYVIVVNFTISFLFEFETFHWILLIILLFMTTPSRPPKMKLGFNVIKMTE